MFLKMYLIVVILNGAIDTKADINLFNSTLRKYAAYVGVDLQITVRNRKDRKCTKGFHHWDNVYKQLDCYRAAYPKEKFSKDLEKLPFTNLLIVRKEFREKDETGRLWTRGGGIGDLCYIGRTDNPIGVTAYSKSKWEPQLKLIAAALIGFHELLHNWCEGHISQHGDPKNLMYPGFFDDILRKYGFEAYYISEDTKKNVQAYLGSLH